MCDYSLEQYRSRPARVGERYETYRFPSDTVGFIAPGDAFTAVCMAYDTRLRLKGVPQAVQNCCQVTADEDATFTRQEDRAVPRRSALRQWGDGDTAAARSGRKRPRHRCTLVTPLGYAYGGGSVKEITCVPSLNLRPRCVACAVASCGSS
jgi:hypothetical protein